MKLCTYRSDDGYRVGVVIDDQVHDLETVARGAGVELPALGADDPLRTLVGLEKVWTSLSTSLPTTLPAGEPVGSVDQMRLAPPIVRPDKVVCIGLNYRSHAEEANMEIPPVPTFFVKLPNAFRGHGDAVVIPRVSRRIDWEGELAVVIGRQCADVTAADALDYVAGYTVVNDATARDYQFKTSQWIVGKTFDSFSPMGPVIATPDELDDPADATITTVVSGTRYQHGSTSDMVFPVPVLIEFLSSIMTLEPGDVIATGTPSGIGALQKPPRWLVDGDVVSITIPGIGTLTNPIAARAGAAS